MNSYLYKKTQLLLIILACAFASGCTSIVASTHQGPLVENEGVRTWGSFIDDGVIESKAKINIINSNALLAQSRVRSISYNGIVLIVGQIPNSTLAQAATDAVKRIRQVKSVENQLVVGPNIGMMQKFRDNLLATKIKVAISSSTNVSVNRIKAVVENSDVYLMGLVTRAEAQTAVQASAQIEGINKIVKVFEYLD